MGVELRHRCRRCRLRLPAPTENERDAFCCRGCYRQHFAVRCMVCESAFKRTAGHQLVCSRPACKTKFRQLRDYGVLGRFYAKTPRPTSAVVSPAKSDNCIALEAASSPVAPSLFRVIAGTMSERDLRLATIGVAFANSPFEHDRKLNRKHWLDAEKARTEANGYFTEPAWREVISADGVSAFRRPQGGRQWLMRSRAACSASRAGNPPSRSRWWSIRPPPSCWTRPATAGRSGTTPSATRATPSPAPNGCGGIPDISNPTLEGGLRMIDIAPQPTATIVPFPIARRRDFIRKQASNAARMHPDLAVRYVERQLLAQRDAMRHRGIAEALIDRELHSMAAAMHAEFLQVKSAMGGA